MEIRIGTSGFSYRWWRGAFYPARLRPAEWLAYYAGRFDAVEINATFYRLPAAEMIRRWRETVPEDFRFVVKGWRMVTHIRRLRDCGEAIAAFMEAIAGLKEKLGPILWQLPPSLERDEALLADFLALLPGPHGHVIEFRHESWFTEGVRALLQAHGCGFCQHDHHGMRTPPWVTGGLLYRRFHGLKRGECYGDDDLRQAAAEMRAAAQSQGARSLWAFFNNDAGACAPRDAERLRACLSSAAVAE
jgi:uncharacterized protein YecE (DUF72 family)